MVVLVHGVVRPRYLTTFLRDNLHAASRARHHPGHRGSIDVHAKPPFEHTSISIWSTRSSAQDFAYQPGGHAPAMKRARELNTHRAGVYLQVRPLASTGNLGIDEPRAPRPSRRRPLNDPPLDRASHCWCASHGVKARERRGRTMPAQRNRARTTRSRSSSSNATDSRRALPPDPGAPACMLRRHGC